MRTLAGLLLSALSLITTVCAAADKPNIVLIYCDDLGYGDLGCYGAKGYETPNLDQMAKEGVRCTDYHSVAAVCSASRAALLTGCYPQRVGILGALGPAAKHGIAADHGGILSHLRTMRDRRPVTFARREPCIRKPPRCC